MGRTTGIVEKINDDIKDGLFVLYLTQNIGQINIFKNMLKKWVCDLKSITTSPIGAEVAYRGRRFDKTYIDNLMPWDYFLLDRWWIHTSDHIEMVGEFKLWMENFEALNKIRKLIEKVNKI